MTRRPFSICRACGVEFDRDSPEAVFRHRLLANKDPNILIWACLQGERPESKAAASIREALVMTRRNVEELARKGREALKRDEANRG